MAKHSTPRSAKRGNAPAPYTKYKKAPYDYRVMYQRLLTDEPDSALAKHLLRKRKERSAEHKLAA